MNPPLNLLAFVKIAYKKFYIIENLVNYTI
jgi:hypothetical protein